MRVKVHQYEDKEACLESKGHYEIERKHVFDGVVRGTLQHKTCLIFKYKS